MLDGRFPTYRLMQETVVGYMRENFLLWDSVEERSARLSEVFGAVKTKMESSPASFQFVQQEYFLRGHEGLGLTLLEHINRGHLSNNQSALRATSYRANTTIESLLVDKIRFAVSAHHLGFYESSFVINAGKLLRKSIVNSLTHLISPAVVSQSPLKALLGGNLHACLGQRFYAIFSRDSLLSDVNYAELSSTCTEMQACLELMLPTDSDSDSDTEINEEPVSLILFIYICFLLIAL